MATIDPLVMVLQAQKAKQRLADLEELQRMRGSVPGWFAEYEKFRNTPWSPTKLPPDQEIQFRNWLSGTDWFDEVKREIASENGIAPESMSNDEVMRMILKDADYDYRGAWVSNPEMSRSQYDKRIHWSSRTPSGQMLKSPNHPTAWKEFFMSETRQDPDSLGLGSIEAARSYNPRGTTIAEQLKSAPVYPEETF